MKLNDEDIAFLEKHYPDNIPINIACEYINRNSEKSKRIDKDSLRVSIKKNNCPFGWCIPSEKGNVNRYRIETHNFIKYFS